MRQIHQAVQRSLAYMPSSAPYRNIGVKRGEDVENIGCACNGKTRDSSKSVHVNQGQDKCVGIKLPKCSLGDNLAVANGRILPPGKSKQSAASSSSKYLEKSMPSSSLRDDFAQRGLEKHALQPLKDNSSDGNRTSTKPLHPRNMSSAEAPLIPNKINRVASSQGNTIGSRVRFADEHHKEQSFKEKEHKNPISKRKCNLGKEYHRGNSDVHQRIEKSCMSNNMKRNGGLIVEDRRTDNDKFKSKGKRPLEQIPREHASGIEDTKAAKVVKKRRYIGTEDEDDISGDGQNIISGHDQNIVSVEDGIDGLTSQTAIVEQYGSLPIDEPIWSGMLKIGSEGYVSLEAHLLAKSCEKVRECSRSLRPMVKVTKLSRFETEPKCFRASGPTEDNIGLYFFPQGMRPNEDYDKLVKEVMDKDLILRAIVDEAEMLIFPSILLPERHQTFQGKQYLWGLFKRRENNINAEGEELVRGRCLSRHEEEKGNQGCSRPRVSKEGIDKERRTASLARSNASTRPVERAAADIATPVFAAAAATSHAPSSATEGATLAPAVTSHAPSSTCPAERAAAEAATPAPAAAATTSHTPSSVVRDGVIYGFIGQPTQQLLQQLVREGAVVFAMPGEMIGCLGKQYSAAAE
ncbi:unnamed protein product [Alopecurus aequalis]